MTGSADPNAMDLSTQQGLEAALRARKRTGKQATAIPVLSRDGKLPLSIAQKSLWFAHLVARDPSSFNVVQAERVHGPLDIACLGNAFDDLVSRHEVLRLQLETTDGAPYWVPSAPLPKLEVHETSCVAEADRDCVAQDLLDAYAATPIDLSAQAPITAKLYRFAKDDALLVMIVHHIACDEWSIATLRADLMTLYSAHLKNAAPDLPDLRLQYADVAAHAGTLEAGAAERAVLDRWASLLNSARTDDSLPATQDTKRTGTQTRAILHRIPKAQKSKLDAIGQEQGATPFMTMLAATLCLLHLETKRTDITIATQVAGRSGPETDKLVGPFTNTVVIRSTVENGAHFQLILQSVREQVRNALAHQHVRFETLLQRLQVARTHDATPFAKIMFTHRQSFSALAFADGITSNPLRPRSKAAKHDLWVSVIDQADGRALRFGFDAARHDRSQIQRLKDDFITLIKRLVSDPDFALQGLEVTAQPLPFIEPPVQSSGTDHPPDRAIPAAGTVEKVAAVWADVLGDVCSDHDSSFFENGGDSLLLLRLVHQIEETFGAQIPLSSVFQTPTIRQIAACLDRHEEGPATDPEWDSLIEPLVARDPGTIKPRFFFVSGGGGHVAPFGRVARRLADRWEGLGVRDPALFDEEPTLKSVEELAARMIQAVRRVDPNGPWVLAGYSAGGRTVYEIARQLRDAGGIAGCVVIDAGASDQSLRAGMFRLMRKIKRAGRITYRRFSDHMADHRNKEPIATEMERRRLLRVSDIQHGRLLRYVPRRSDTPLTLVRAQSSARRRRRADYGWSDVADFIEAVETPGNHFDCFRDQNERPFASALAQALETMHSKLETELLDRRDHSP